MNALELSSKLCGDIVHRVVSEDGRNFIVTPFRYPDGDYINLYVESFGGTTFISDCGDTLYKFRVSGLNYTEARMEIIKNVCRLHDVTFEKPAFRKKIDPKKRGSDCLAFCGAIAQISTLDYEAGPRLTADFEEEVDVFVRNVLEPIRVPTRKWTHPTIDIHKAFPVDYHFNGSPNQINLFQIASVQKIDRVCAVIGYLRYHSVLTPSICVVGKDVELRGANLDRLNESTNQILVGVNEHAELIKEMVLSN
jgi:hypothetical protein